jgi:glucose-1-phosphate thymidylyltransferase
MSMPLKGIVLAPSPKRGPSPLPRALLPSQQRVANRPIICHVIDALRDAGVDDVAVIGNSASLRRLGGIDQPPLGGVTYIESRAADDLVALISAGGPFVGDDPCVVHLADGLAGAPITPLHELCSGAPDVGVFVHHGSGRQAGLGGELERLLGIAPLDRGRGELGIAGVGFLGPGAIHTACSPEAASRRSTPGLTALAERISAGGGRLHVGRVSSWRRYGGDPEDLLEINRMVLDGLPGARDPGELAFPGSRVEGRVQIHPGATIIDSVISGPAIIGAGAHIESAYIGPYTSIGTGVRVLGSEVERSIVHDDTTIENVASRIEGSTLGPRARIARRFFMPRGLRLHVGEGAELVLD